MIIIVRITVALIACTCFILAMTRKGTSSWMLLGCAFAIMSSYHIASASWQRRQQPELEKKKKEERVEQIMKSFQFHTIQTSQTKKNKRDTSNDGTDDTRTDDTDAASTTSKDENDDQNKKDENKQNDKASSSIPTASKTILESLSQEGAECCICLETYLEGQEICYTTRKNECNHYFHTDCAMQWFQNANHNDCPLCRIQLIDHQASTTTTTTTISEEP